MNRTRALTVPPYATPGWRLLGLVHLLTTVGLLLLLAACGAPGQDQSAPLSERFDEGGAVEVRLAGYQINMPTSVAAGPTTFRIVNEGSRVHGFEIEGQGIEKKVEEIEPGQTATLDVDLQPGRYTVYCPVADHEEKGMTMPLVVTEGGPAES